MFYGLSPTLIWNLVTFPDKLVDFMGYDFPFFVLALVTQSFLVYLVSDDKVDDYMVK